MQLPTNEVNELATKATIGTTGSIYAWLDMPLSTWVALATFVYMLCQIIVIFPRVVETFSKALEKRKEKDEQGK